MSKLVIIRHGESVWNLENRFTGWMDVPLSTNGRAEAVKAGQKLKDYRFDKIYISHLYRSVETLFLMLEQSNDKRTPMIFHIDDEEERVRAHYGGDYNKELTIIQTKLIAERYYGDLQGLNKDEMRRKLGEEQVHIWRRSFDVPPPNGESLKDTVARVIPFFHSHIAKDLREGKNVLIAAHGNSLRAIVKFLENISDADIPNYELKTGVPIEYDLDNELRVISKKELI